MKSARIKRAVLSGRVAVVAAGILVCSAASTARADVAFQYDEITDTIVSAAFSVDFAAMNAHRTMSGFEMNFAQLVDCNPGGSLLNYDMSDDLFGAVEFPDPPQLNMGGVETGWISSDIDSSFYPALAGGKVGLRALFTDTVDSMFAMDCIVLAIETDAETILSYYGWPVDNENNGFGLGLADGGDLPDVLPDSLPVGSTGTGFDETISSKSILAIPEPSTALLLGLAIGFVLFRRRRT